MRHSLKSRMLIILAVVSAGLLGWPAAASAQTSGGAARAVQATLFSGGLLGLTGVTTTLADTGVLAAGTSDERQASAVSGSVPSLLSADSLHATAIGGPDWMDSEASIGSLGLVVGTVSVAADLVMARAAAASGATPAGSSDISGLTINGVPVTVTGAPNQTIPIAGGRIVLNEQQIGTAGAVVNALHVVISGVADVVIAQANAVIQ